MVEAAQRGDHSSRSRIAPGLKQPTRGSRRHALSSATCTGRAGPPLLFDLAPRGVFRAPGIAAGAVGSYPTFSPLPSMLDRMGRAPGLFRKPAAEVQVTPAVYSLWHFPWRVVRCACAPLAAQPPGVTRRVALPWPALASSPRLESGLSSRSPFVRLAADSGQAGDRPTHPPRSLYPGSTAPCAGGEVE